MVFAASALWVSFIVGLMHGFSICYVADLPDNCFGRMYFREAKATVYWKPPHSREVIPHEKEIAPGTMLISRQRYFLGHDGTHRLTIAHEIIHWYIHKKYFMLLALLDDETDMMSCEVEPNHYDESMSLAQKAHWFAEWQANALSIRIAMPKALMVHAFQEAYDAAEVRPGVKFCVSVFRQSQEYRGNN